MSARDAVKVLENRMIGTRSVYDWCGFVVAHSLEALLQMTRGVKWHDERQNCPTWAEGVECRCDVEGM